MKRTHRLPAHPLPVLDRVLYVPTALTLDYQTLGHRLQINVVQTVFTDKAPLVEVGLVRPGSGDGFGHVVVTFLPTIWNCRARKRRR